MTKFQLNYYKPKKVELDVLAKQNQETAYQPFDIDQFQSYHPIYSLFFELTESNSETVALNHRFHMADLESVWDKSERVPKELFIKFAPLLDPVRYLIGRYKQQSFEMPQFGATTCHEKLASYNNASYIDNFFCYLSSQMIHHHGILHGVDYYGSYMGVQKKFKMNLADDIDYLTQSEYFNEHRGKMYEVEATENPFANFGSRTNKDKLSIHSSSNVSHLSLEDLEIEVSTEVSPQLEVEESEECIYEKDSVVSSEDSSNDSEVNYSENESEEAEAEDEDAEDEEDDEDEDDEDEEEDEDDEDDEDDEEEEEESETPLNAFIYNFPVQMICLEKCSGTLDRLFVKHILDIDSAASALFQVIMTLMAFQKAYAFTHNDLHTNNIMYIETDIEYLYYKAANGYYKVPTYGRLFKLIDFGRAIYKFQGKTFCSDSFAPGGDASSQYNCEPFFNENKPRLDPNYSFDLCRLGCSIYDFLLDIDEEQDPDFEADALQKLIIKWVTDDNKKNVLYMKNGDERYPNFKLYKMIARTVHNKTPEDEINDPLFDEYRVAKEDIPADATIMNIDELPSYTNL